MEAYEAKLLAVYVDRASQRPECSLGEVADLPISFLEMLVHRASPRKPSRVTRRNESSTTRGSSGRQITPSSTVGERPCTDL